ncbi:MAG: M23 family metallopeptidase [Ruminococcaceae bacterium]|nr:M23 family metallopeptidase [Oscillospiraceae bacterium]
MWKKWKESEFYQKLKQVRVNRAVYMTAIIILLSFSVILAVTVATNRANKKGDDTLPTPDISDTVPEAPSDTTPDGGNDSEPTIKDTVPELCLPVSTGVLSKRHSVDAQVFSPTMNDYRVHLGVDISTEASAPVSAVADGTVAQLWEDPMMGWCLAIDHAGDSVSVYKNLAADFAEGIAVGESVKAGQIIGHVGDTAMMEIAEEPHLHLELTVGGIQVDPMEYFSESVKTALTEDSIYESENGK